LEENLPVVDHRSKIRHQGGGRGGNRGESEGEEVREDRRSIIPPKDKQGVLVHLSNERRSSLGFMTSEKKKKQNKNNEIFSLL